MKKLFFFLAFLTATLVSPQLQAQKYGHINLGNLLEQMPEVLVANNRLIALNDSLGRVDSLLTIEFQAEYEKYMQESQAGLLTRVQQQQREEKLQAQQQAVLAFEEKANTTVQTEKEKYLTPIVQRAKDAIRDVAKEKGMAMVFDTSSGVMLFVTDAEDVMPLVKAKLGITK